MWFRQWWAISKLRHSRIKRKTTAGKNIPFIIEKSISALITPKTVKNLKNGTILIEVTEKKQSEIILKQKKIHNIDIKAYPYERLNTSKGVIRNGELSLCSIMEIKNELKKQNVIDVKRITIKKTKWNNWNQYLHFNLQ